MNLAELISSERDRAYRLALGITGDAETAADALQDACLSVLAAAREGGAPEPRSRAWFLKAVANTARDLITGNARRRAREERWAMNNEPPADRTPSQQCLHSEMVRAVAQAMRELDPRYRLPLALCYEEGLTHAEVAEVLGLERSSVGFHVQRALDQLKAKLAERGIRAAPAAVIGGFGALSLEPAPPAVAAAVDKLLAGAGAAAGKGAGGAAGLPLGWMLGAGLAAAATLGIAILALRPPRQPPNSAAPPPDAAADSNLFDPGAPPERPAGSRPPPVKDSPADRILRRVTAFYSRAEGLEFQSLVRRVAEGGGRPQAAGVWQGGQRVLLTPNAEGGGPEEFADLSMRRPNIIKMRYGAGALWTELACDGRELRLDSPRIPAANWSFDGQSLAGFDPETKSFVSRTPAALSRNVTTAAPPGSFERLWALDWIGQAGFRWPGPVAVIKSFVVGGSRFNVHPADYLGIEELDGAGHHHVRQQWQSPAPAGEDGGAAVTQDLWVLDGERPLIDKAVRSVKFRASDGTSGTRTTTFIYRGWSVETPSEKKAVGDR